MSLGKVKGFKNDKRNLIEATNNLVVFGQGQAPPELVKGRRLLRRGQGNLRKPYTTATPTTVKTHANRNGHHPSTPGYPQKPAKSKSGPPTGPAAVEARTPGQGKTQEGTMRKDLMLNYFSNTKPWIRTSQMEEQAEQTQPPMGDADASDGASLKMKQQQQPQRNSIESAIFTNDIVCPVCLKGFEPFQNIPHVPVTEMMKHSRAAYQLQSGLVYRKTLEEGWGAMAKPKYVLEPEDVVVAANCGELFHKLCLREWCARTHSSKSPRTQKPVATCPSCGKDLKFTVFQEIEVYRNFSDEPTAVDKELNKTKHTHRELQLLWPQTNTFLANVKQNIKDTQTVYNELRAKKRSLKAELRKLTADDLSIIMNKVSNVDEIKDALSKQEKALSFMQQETLQIMRMYLLTLVRKYRTGSTKPSTDNIMMVPVDVEAMKNRIPESLIPHLNTILNDDEALALLSRIVAPRVGDSCDEESKHVLERQILTKCAVSNFDSSCPPTVPQKSDTYTLLQTSAFEIENTDRDVGNKSSSDVMIPAPVPPIHKIPSLKQVKPTQNSYSVEADSSVSTFISDSLLSLLKVSPKASSSDASIVVRGYRHDYDRDTADGPRKPPKICRIIEIRESDQSDLKINPSADFSANDEQKKEYHDTIWKSSSMEVAATSLPPTSTSIQNSESSVAPSTNSSGVKLDPESQAKSGHVKRDEDPLEEVIKAPRNIHPSPESSIGEIEGVKNSPLAKQICELVQKNARKMNSHLQRNVESSSVYQEFEFNNGPGILRQLRTARSLGNVNLTEKTEAVTATPKAEKKVELEKVQENEDEKKEDDDSWATVKEGEDENSWSTVTSNDEDDEEEEMLVDHETKVVKKVCNGTGVQNSCEVVYTSKNQEDNSLPQLGLTGCLKSDTSSMVGKEPSKELSIAIMYIIEDDNDNEENDNENKRKNRNRKESKEKMLEPIYVTAEKSSKFSMVFNSEGEDPIMMSNSDEYEMDEDESGSGNDNENDNGEEDELRDEESGLMKPPPEVQSWPLKPHRDRNNKFLQNNNNNNANFLFQNKFGYQHEQIVSLPTMIHFPRRRNVQPTMFFENETIIKKRSQVYGRIIPTKYETNLSTII